EGDGDVVQRARARHADRVQRGLAADAAARSRVEVPLEAREIDRLAGMQLDAHNVALAGRRVGLARPADAGDPGAGGDDAFGIQETERELLVLARRAHGHGDAPGRGAFRAGRAELDLERLLDRDVVAPRDRDVPFDLPDVHGEAVGGHGFCRGHGPPIISPMPRSYREPGACGPGAPWL